MSDGKPDFDVGDLVVCVDDGPNVITGKRPSLSKRGTVFRVGRMWPPEKTKRGLWLFDEVGRQPHERGHFAYRFRKIDRADDEFTAMLRQTRPVDA